MTVYKENGYSNREDYLKSLAEGFDMEYEAVVFYAKFSQAPDFSYQRVRKC